MKVLLSITNHLFIQMLLRFLFLILFLIPATLYSTDIYTSSHGEVKIYANLNSHIISGDSKLGNTLLVVSAPIEQKNIHIVSSCEHTESVLYKEPTQNKKMVYVIQVAFPTLCDIQEIRIGNSENIFTDTIFSLPLESLNHLENSFIDTDNEHLLSIMREPSIALEAGVDGRLVQKLSHVQTLYKNLDIALESDMARSILQDRDNLKYISPVAGYELPNDSVRIPGAGRPYRLDTTDGIHHGWDIMAPYGTPVRALAKGKIIRVINNWSWADFKKFKTEKLTPDDEAENLNIYRGNQIWLQTMDGNVTFYSHLSAISPDITVGSLVEAGTTLGNIGTSGVPDKNYKNIHLHFEIQENPFIENQKNPTYLEIMRWNYIGEHMNANNVREIVKEKFDQGHYEIVKK